MTEPTTEAGRAMLADNAARGPIWPGPMLDYILAIEAEARAEALRDVREAVNAFGFAAKPNVLAAIARLASEDRP